jgi:hypothetical protein
MLSTVGLHAPKIIVQLDLENHVMAPVS